MYDPESEQALIASIFQEPESIDAVSEVLRPEEFYDPRNELIFSTATRLHMNGGDFKPAAIASTLRSAGELDKAGGIPYIHQLINPTNIPGFGSDPLTMAKNIKDAARRRATVAVAQEMMENAQYGSGLSGEQAIEAAEQSIQRVLNSESVSGAIHSIASMYDDAIVRFEEAAAMPEGVEIGINTGFTDLDDILGGLRGTRLYYLAARPGSGKTTLALDIARSAALLQGKTVLFFSLEMSHTEVFEKIMSAEARVELKKLQKGDLSEEDWFNIREAEGMLKRSNFLVDPSPNVGLPKIRTLALRQNARPEGLDMIIIDYLQLMEVPRGSSKQASRQEQVSELSRGLKLLAKELDVPVIVLSQLNRSSENRADLTPKVSDLRESGSLEQDADVVILINRPEVNDPNNRPGETDIIVGKNRHGRQDRVKLTSMLAYSKFVNAVGTVERETVVDEAGAAVSKVDAGDDEMPW
jgi:replicative DNA helicase